MESKYLKQSFALHALAIFLLWVDLPDFRHDELTIGQTPIIVDLSEVRIDEMTNLPSKAEFGDEDRKATVEEHKPVEQYTKDVAEPEPEETPEDEPQEIKDDYLEPPVPDKKPEKKPEQKPTPKPAPKQPPRPSMKPKPKPKPQPKKPDNKKPEEKSKVHSSALKSLMQEIDNSKNLEVGDRTQSAMVKTGTEVKHMGIEGGNSQGSYLSDLTISETDAIASLLRQNWNLDPGAMGVDGLKVEIRVYLSREGTIQKIEFVDQHRFNTDPSYRSVAESAQRAIIATQQAFKDVFAGKYADHYDVWRVLHLFFDPLDKGIQ